MIDYDDVECTECGRIGVLPDGGLDWICSNCGHEGTFEKNNHDEDDDD